MKREQTPHSRFWSSPYCRLIVILTASLPTLARLSAVSFVLVLSTISIQSHQHDLGRIEGTVIDFAGSPVPNATVYVLQSGRSPATITDAKGKFVLANLEAGAQRVFAYKESDNYPNPVWSFYEDAQGQKGFPLVRVQNDHPLRNVMVRLGPKSSRLVVKIIDAITKQPVSDAAILLNHEGKPKTLFNPGATGPSGELPVLIPSGIPVNVKVTAAGYQTYIYRNERRSKSTNAIQLKIGETRRIEIELTRN